jgi:hypothetical protein
MTPFLVCTFFQIHGISCVHSSDTSPPHVNGSSYTSFLTGGHLQVKMNLFLPLNKINANVAFSLSSMKKSSTVSLSTAPYHEATPTHMVCSILANSRHEVQLKQFRMG